MTDAEIIEELHKDSLLNRVRGMVSGHAAAYEQAFLQRTPPTAVECRRMEFNVAQNIIDVVRSQLCLEVLEKNRE